MRLKSILLSILLAASCVDAADYNIHFNKVLYTIPKEYVPSWARPEVLNEPNDLLVRVYLPDFTPRPTRQLPPELRGGHGDKIIAIFRKRLTELNASYAHVAAARIENEPYRDEYGLRSFRAGRHYRHPLPQPLHVLFAHEKQTVTVLIVCEPWHRSPSCVHKFNADEISFRLRYAMRHLAEWKKIQTGIIDKLRSFRRPLK